MCSPLLYRFCSWGPPSTAQAGIVVAWGLSKILRIFGFDGYFNSSSTVEVFAEYVQLEKLGISQPELAACLTEAHDASSIRIRVGNNVLIVSGLPRDCFTLTESFKSRDNVTGLEALYGAVSILNETSVSFSGLSKNTMLELHQLANRNNSRGQTRSRLPFNMFILDGE